jgi:hypothetical protein
MRYDQRPADDTPVHTADLPDTPVRDRNIPATAWIEAPPSLLTLGDDLPGKPVAEYKRRIGTWLLWRAGPATGADARYWAQDVDGRESTFRLFPDGSGDGLGPSGTRHTRFRAWKEDLAGRDVDLTCGPRAGGDAHSHLDNPQLLRVVGTSGGQSSPVESFRDVWRACARADVRAGVGQP